MRRASVQIGIGLACTAAAFAAAWLIARLAGGVFSDWLAVAVLLLLGASLLLLMAARRGSASLLTSPMLPPDLIYETTHSAPRKVPDTYLLLRALPPAVVGVGLFFGILVR